MYSVYFIRALLSVYILYQISIDFSRSVPTSLIPHCLHLNALPNKQHSTGELSDLGYARYMQGMQGVFYKVLPYFIRISLRFVETVFCKVFYRLFSVIPHFFQRCPLLNKRQETWAPSDFPDINPDLQGFCGGVSQRGFSRVYTRYTGSIMYRVIL